MSTPLPSLRHHNTLSLPTGYRRVLRLTFARQGNVATVDPTSARFTQDSRRALRWDGEVTITDPALQPVLPTDLLTPFGTVATAELGVRLADGTESVVPYGVYLVGSTKTSISPTERTTTITLVDLAHRVDAYRFETPFTVAAGTDLAQVVNLVVANRTGVDPGLSNVGRTTGADRVFGLEPDTGPWAELLDVLNGFGMTAWYDRVGQVAIGDQQPDAESVTSLDNVLDLAADFDVRPANVCVARGESPEGNPVQAVAMDDNPASPTYAGTAPGSSAYGRVTRYFSSPLITTVGQAQDAAQGMLARELGAGASFTLSRPFDPTVDVDDGVSVSGRVLAVDAVTVNLTGQTTMQVRSV